MKEVYYWSPCLSNVGTINSTINSAIGLATYSKSYRVKIINACGEWDNYKNFFLKKNVELIDFPIKIFKFLPKEGYFKSRVSYSLIFLLSFFPLLNLIKKKSPDFLIMHLITSLPLCLLFFFKFNTNFILRISGLPKMNFIRKKFWTLLSGKIYKVTTPTKQLLNHYMSANIFDKEKIFFLPDAMINIKKFINSQINYKSKNLNLIEKKYFIAVGRLSKQKNFSYLINEFSNFIKEKKNYNLLIFGKGEEKEKLLKLIKKKNSSDNIFLMGFSENVQFYMKKSTGFILSSLWEEPGAVLIESALSNTYIISSDCPYGPSEIISNGKYGFLYESNKKNALKNQLNEFCKNFENLKNKKIGAKKNCLKYTMFRHYVALNKLLV